MMLGGSDGAAVAGLVRATAAATAASRSKALLLLELVDVHLLLPALMAAEGHLTHVDEGVAAGAEAAVAEPAGLEERRRLRHGEALQRVPPLHGARPRPRPRPRLRRRRRRRAASRRPRRWRELRQARRPPHRGRRGPAAPGPLPRRHVPPDLSLLARISRRRRRSSSWVGSEEPKRKARGRLG
uniref:Uncharacterized protein n=1 Tax=Arundo donax TaxID=35708 RepID=A0A0A9G5E8_ARUDO